MTINFFFQRTFPRVAAVVLTDLAAACASFYEVPGSPLAEAAWRGDVHAIRALVAGGADPNAYDATGYTPLLWAARGGHALGPHACGNEDPSRPAVVAALIDLGANPNLTDHRRHYPGGSSGWTALIEALHHEQFATAQLLIERGADTSIASNEGMSPRQMAEAEGAPPTLVARLSAR